MAADRPDDKEPARALGRALRDLQRRSGCTLRSLETSVRISDSSLSRYFRGTTVPPWATVRDLCEALDGDPADFRPLWEAADRSQRRPAQGADLNEGDPEAAEDPPRRPFLRNGRAVWALAGTALGFVLGATAVGLLQPGSPATGDAAPTPAPGATGASGHPRIFVNRATGACLDDSLDMGTRSYPCNGLPYQRWTVRTAADGSVQLRNHATGECLDHHPSGPRTVACGSPATQRWSVSEPDDTAAQISSTAPRGCLDDSAEGLRVVPCDRTARQKWA
ncbi:RICIN domain-containing protein [Streptomyces sp. NPDC054975]